MVSTGRRPLVDGSPVYAAILTGSPRLFALNEA
jgi:hypothetical protein